ncbi:hypothetical protein RRG08_003728 [Elysia crispata]|uniref:Uncharacterized protein n=1 Tax=Elysia crispata TaxID=231223 RepID=A0AAE1E4Z7_9GAST|nr:hypothetical protein RRG08_003728 [Elysia crispata]
MIFVVILLERNRFSVSMAPDEFTASSSLIVFAKQDTSYKKEPAVKLMIVNALLLCMQAAASSSQSHAKIKPVLLYIRHSDMT